MDTLPHEFAAARALRWRLAGAFIRGPQSVFGEAVERRTDGGGRWEAELGDIPLLSDASQRTWEALLLGWSLGDTKLIVPRCARSLKADYARSAARVPHSDDTPFDDDSLYVSEAEMGALAAALDLRDTEAQITLPAGAVLTAGEPFTLVGDVYGPRLYGVSRVLDVTGQVATVSFAPPAREAYALETAVDFGAPRCTMRAQLADGAAWPTLDVARQGNVSILFRETWT